MNKFINTYKDLFSENKVKHTNLEIDQKYYFGSDYENQKATADSFGTVPEQLLFAKADASLIIPEEKYHNPEDFMLLEGGIYMDNTEIGYTAYFMLDYSVGRE